MLPGFLEDPYLKFRFFVGGLIRRNASLAVDALVDVSSGGLTKPDEAQSISW
ncbi:MAG: hypothetical protein VX910_08915 [Candidatus Latescibacterota bacterium]|nr:hypothetical protein [Candidatus Latescibacterota bacterium]